MQPNYYIVLGIPVNSNQEDIKAAYRKLAKEFHPDHYDQDGSPFLGIQEAYSVLGDPIRRRSYDSSLQKEHRIERSARQPASRRQRYYQGEVEPLIPKQGAPSLRDVSLRRSFDLYRPTFASLFDRLLSNFDTRRQHPKGERLENMTVVIPLTPHQAHQGGHVRLLVPARQPCPSCQGRGGVGHYECWRCGGEGYFTSEQPVEISYPPGTVDNRCV